jgi:RNA polymerase sigma-70 factor (ECF subfamily)
MSPQKGNEPGEVTALLRRIESGDRAALDLLMDLIYPELRRIAQSLFRKEAGERILQPTALVNEAYLRLLAHQQHRWENRAHFLGAAARAMHRILIERARARLAGKRSAERVPIDEALGLTSHRAAELVALEDGLAELARVSPRQARVIELRYFGGLTVEETAEALGLTPRTVDRDWAVARAWLRRYLKR